MEQCRRILIVEDDDVIRESLQQILTNQGYLAETAADGGLALDHLRRHSDVRFLVLLDLMMPRVTGWDFLKARMQDEFLMKIPVVVFSAGGDSASDIRNHGAEFLRKPIRIEQLFKVVERHCGSEARPG